MVKEKREIRTVRELVDSGLFGNRTEEVRKALKKNKIGGL